MAVAARYIVGIDLGTTNTVVAYAKRDAAAPDIHVFPLEQLVNLGEVAARPTLPSLRYHPAADEIHPRDMQLPWGAVDPAGAPAVIIGELARELGAQVPGRLVASAKSWLCHAAVDRTAPILPWAATPDVAKVSPLAASASYLAHLRAAWNQHHNDAPLEQQDIVLTVPASFDEDARSLTQRAAQLAGLPRVRLVEEPQAACYDFLFRHRHDLASALGSARLVLVCDVGGGTTDLTLIRIAAGAAGPQLTRIAVGEHLMLGGDNMDLGVARLMEPRLIQPGAPLSSARLAQLVQQCRRAKERLLAPDAPERVTVTLLGGGSKLVGGARSAELSRQEVHDLIVEGFFPCNALDEGPQRKRSALVEFGLPYAADPAVTRHIAGFLATHACAAREALGDTALGAAEIPVPDALLLNGGVFRSAALEARLAEVLQRWRGAPVQRLDNDAPELAVARGAVAYGLARLGAAPRIASGAARSYFMLLNAERGAPRQAVCVLPKGTEEGSEIRLAERTFALRVGQPVKFDLGTTNDDTPRSAGDIAAAEHLDLHALPPMAAVLERRGGGGEVPVQVVTSLTELGVLEMHCVSTADPSQRWRLDFQLRGTGALQGSAQLPPRFGEAAQAIQRIFGGRSQSVEAREVKRLRVDLEKILGERDSWDTNLLRELFVVLWDGAARRRRSADHERVWFNLAGFCLRPGFGYPLDDWRVSELWALYPQGVQFVPEAPVWAEWWTLWRRVAGGLDEAAQTRIFDDIVFYLQPAGVNKIPKPAGPKRQGADDMLRLAASLERVPAARKVELGEWLLQRARKADGGPQLWWTLGRLGARVPFSASVHHVVDKDTAAQWLQAVLALDWKNVQPAAFAAATLARVSGDRARDLDEPLRETVAARLRAARAPNAWIDMVQGAVNLDEADEGRVFGESLPPGLRLIA